MSAAATAPFVFIGCVEVRQALQRTAADERELVDRLEEVPTGTRVLSRIDGVQSFWLSTMGLMFDVRSVVAARQSVTSRNFAKLKQILEAAPRQ